jgi:hypothetical protein
MKDCKSCKHKNSFASNAQCFRCVGCDLWEPPENPTTIKWRHVSEPPAEPTLVLISFKEPVCNNVVSEGQYFPDSSHWVVFDASLEYATPEFYIPIKDLNIPPHRSGETN